MSCYIVVEMFVSSGASFITSAWKLIDQNFYSQFPTSLDWRFEYAILNQIQSSNHQHCKNTVISPNFLVWKFCGKAQFPHSFGRNYAETVPFHKISTPQEIRWNYGFFSQWNNNVQWYWTPGDVNCFAYLFTYHSLW